MRLFVAGALALAVAAACAPAAAHTEEVTLRIHWSRFDPAAITLPAGVPVTFTLENGDPIAHEWIVGPPEVHAIHRVGTEAAHEGRPNEVTLPAYATRVTTVTFDRPGTYAFICHLPGHEQYGMTGLVRVVAR